MESGSMYIDYMLEGLRLVATKRLKDMSFFSC